MTTPHEHYLAVKQVRTELTQLVEQFYRELSLIKTGKFTPEHINARKNFDSAFNNLQNHSKIFSEAYTKYIMSKNK